MAVCDIMNLAADKVGETDLNDTIFNVSINPSVLHDVVKMQLANRRSGNSCTKTRSEVSGGGAKPWRQKGTGRARSGSKTSPVWRGGGTMFGPKPRDYHYLLPKKVRRLALKMALSDRFSEGNLVIVDSLKLDKAKTKEFVEIMNKFSFDNCLIIADNSNTNLFLSSKNTSGYKVLPVAGLNVYDILKYSKIMLDQSVIKHLEERLLS